MIHIFGDSHRAFFTNSKPYSCKPEKFDILRSYHLGPGTAHNFFQNRHYKMMDVLKTVPKEHCVLIVAGEIDCRLHIPKIHLTTHIDIERLVYNTVHNIMLSILDLKSNGYQVIAWGPHPTRVLEELDYNPEWYYGNQKIRNITCSMFNSLLENEAVKHNIPFGTNFYDILKNDTDYEVYDQFFRDPLHLNNTLQPQTFNTIKKIYDKYNNF